MPDDTDWLMRPVLRHLCSYRELTDGSLTLMDLGRMNDAVEVQDENEQRMIDWHKANPGG